MRFMMIAVALVGCCGMRATNPAVKNPAVERYQHPREAVPSPPKTKTSFLDRLRLNPLWNADESARDVTPTLPKAKSASSSVVLVPQIKSD